MCFSATVNFLGSAALGTAGVVTLTKVKHRMMVAFGAANVVILLIVIAVERYAFTSVWCAYAAAASLIILYYFWTSHEKRPFRYGLQSQK